MNRFTRARNYMNRRIVLLELGTIWIEEWDY